MTTQGKEPGKEVPRALVYSTQSALLIVGSTGSCSCANVENGAQACYLNSDQNARKIHGTFIKDAKFMEESQTKLILSSSNECSKEKVLESIRQQASQVSGEDGMFIFVYTGGVCDKLDHGIGFDTNKLDNLGEVLQDDSVERYSLVLNQYDFKSPETALLGSEIGKAIQEGKPEQVFLILECPHAKEIATSLQGSLSKCNFLEVAVPMGLKRAPCYVRSLNCSTFAYFFSLIINKTKYTSGMFPLKKVLSQVQKCCEALSCLDMVQDGDWIRKNATIPESQFMEIPEKVEKNQNVGEDDCAEVESDSIDGDFRFQSLIEKFYSWKKSFFWIFQKNTVKPCAEAADWARAATKVYLTVLEHENVLEGPVLEAAVGSIVSSIVTIQMKKEGGISSSNFFIQAYMLAVAAVDFVSPNNPELQKDSLLTSAAAYYLSATGGCPSQAREDIEKIVKTLKTDS